MSHVTLFQIYGVAAMKWLNRTAQGFSPGKASVNKTPCRGGRSTCSLDPRYRDDYGARPLASWLAESNKSRRQRVRPIRSPFQGEACHGRLPIAKALGCSVGPLRGQEQLLSINRSLSRIEPEEHGTSGSVLVFVLVLVVIAGLIGASYLTFVDNERARTARNLNQDGLRISTEQALLSLESAIRSELIATGEVKLAGLNRSETLSGISLSLSSKTDGDGSEVLQVQPFANSREVVQLPALASQDLFGRAHARVTLIDVDITALSTVPSVRQPNLTVNDRPQIAVREIPVSQFTVFSAGDPVTLGNAVFSQDIGRVFSESNLSITGNFSSDFAVIAGQNVNFAGGSLQIKDPSDNGASVKLSTDTQDANFLPDARTSLDSRVVTSSVLPVDSAALNSVYGAGNRGSATSNGLNLSLLKTQCEVLVVARPDITITAPNGKKGCLVTVVGNVGGAHLAYPMANKAPSESQSTAAQQTVPFAAAPNTQNPSQTILALDYARLGVTQLESVFLVVQDPAGNPLPNAVILIRGAQALTRSISIVSPHPIIIAGDFNLGDDSPAASIITPANLQTVVADWGSDVFGNI